MTVYLCKVWLVDNPQFEGPASPARFGVLMVLDHVRDFEASEAGQAE